MQALIAAKKFKLSLICSLASILFLASACKKSGECICQNQQWGTEVYEYTGLSKKEAELIETNCINYGNCEWQIIE